MPGLAGQPQLTRGQEQGNGAGLPNLLILGHRSRRQGLRAGNPVLASALRAALTAALRWQPSGIGQSRPRQIRRTTMSNHNLYTLSADGAVVPASSEAILVAARQALAHRVRRGASLQSPQKTGEYLMARLGHLDYEVFGLILLDKRHRVIECIDLFRGTIDGASVHPREVVKLALLKSAAACIVYHNHPSGVQEPSQADELITARVKEALALIDVRLIDHLILTGTGMLSFAERGLI